MQVGCGVYVHRVRRRQYLYFWHYETRGGRRVQVKEYIGPSDSPRTKAEAARRVGIYLARVAVDLERVRAAAVEPRYTH
jgi:hypothetical protein